MHRYKIISFNRLLFPPNRIEIDIDFNERPKGIDPKEAMDRLEAIERETTERLKRGNDNATGSATEMRAYLAKISNAESSSALNPEEQPIHAMDDVLAYDFEMWQGIEDLAPASDPYGDVDVIFDNAAAAIVPASTGLRRNPLSQRQRNV